MLSEGKNLQEELIKATKVLEEESTRLVIAINNRKFDDAATAEVLVTVANAKLAILKTQFIENNGTLSRLRKKMNNSNKYYLNVICPFLLKIFYKYLYINFKNKLIITT